MPTQKQIVSALLNRHGRTFAAELGADISRNTPAPLFRLLCLSLLTSAPVQADIALKATRALANAGWTTPRKLQQSSWAQRVKTLNQAGYARIDEKTATRLAELNETLLREYNGDLRRLRQRAGGDIERARKALKGFKGIGAVGADIFLREVQAVWPEFHPFADKASLAAAERLDLPVQAGELTRLVDRHAFPKLVAALVRTQLNKDFDAVRQAAG